MRSRVRLIYPFDYPVAAIWLILLFCAEKYDFRINWDIVLDARPDLILLVQGVPWALGAAFLWQWLAVGRRPSEIVGKFWGSLKRASGNWRVWYEVARAIVALRACLLAFVFLKQALPLMNPRLYDAQLEALDRAFHLGASPVELTLAAFSWWPVARSLDIIYTLWYLMKGPVLLLFLFYPNPRRRWHLLTSYVLLWILGWVLYLLWPSLGPEYVHPERFSGLYTPTADRLQDWLWQTYMTLKADPAHYRMVFYSGVAAFPSLHVGFAVLFAIALWPYRALFWLMVAFAAAIQIGSVLLGWHYAIDGYAGGLLAAACYFGTRPLFRSDVRRSIRVGATRLANWRFP